MAEEEYQGRVATVRERMAGQDLDALVVYGDNYCYADLCYLTNYFPKVRGGIGLIPRAGPISLLLNIGSRDVPFAKSLTWVEDVRASGQVGRDGAELLREKDLSRATIGLADSGKGFPLPQLEELKANLPGVEWKACDPIIAQMRLLKSPTELGALRQAGRVLNEVCVGAADFIRPGRKGYEVVADLDGLARNRGVEDIRILAGESRLQPPSFKMTAEVGSHWAVYLAIQHDRYWVEAGRTYLLSEDLKLRRAYQKGQEIVAQMAAQLKPGNSIQAIVDTAREELGEFYATASMYGLGNGVGLNQWEAPFLTKEDEQEFGAPLIDAGSVRENMTLGLRFVFESEGKLVICGDSYEVTANGPTSLVNQS